MGPKPQEAKSPINGANIREVAYTPLASKSSHTHVQLNVDNRVSSILTTSTELTASDE